MTISASLAAVYRQMSDRQATVEAYSLGSSADELSYEQLLTKTVSAQAASAAQVVRLLRELEAEPAAVEVMVRYRRCLLLANGPQSGDGGSVVAGSDWRVIESQAGRLLGKRAVQLFEAWQGRAALRASRETALAIWGKGTSRSDSLVAAEEYELAIDLWQRLCAETTSGSRYDRTRPIREALAEMPAEQT